MKPMSQQVKESIEELRSEYIDQYFASGDKPDYVFLKVIETFELLDQRILNIECFIKKESIQQYI